MDAMRCDAFQDGVPFPSPCCASCALPVESPVVYEDGRNMCEQCCHSSVWTSSEAREVAFDVLPYFHSNWPTWVDDPHGKRATCEALEHLPIHAVSAAELCALAAKHGSVSEAKQLCGATLVSDAHVVDAVIVLQGLPRCHTGRVLAHEFCHAALRLDASRRRRHSRLYGFDGTRGCGSGSQGLELEEEEGVCELWAVGYLARVVATGDAEAAKDASRQLTALLANDVPLYSRGLSNALAHVQLEKSPCTAPTDDRDSLYPCRHRCLFLLLCFCCRCCQTLPVTLWLTLWRFASPLPRRRQRHSTP
jgi:hypothetical protein